jgi:hypothetical protein
MNSIGTLPLHHPEWAKAFLATSAIVDSDTPRCAVRADPSQSCSVLAPLLALHEQQQSAMLEAVIMEASLMMCSQLGADLRDVTGKTNSTPQ